MASQDTYVMGAVTKSDKMHLVKKPGLLVLFGGRPKSLCGLEMGVYGKKFNYIGQVACKDCRREYARSLGYDVKW